MGAGGQVDATIPLEVRVPVSRASAQEEVAHQKELNTPVRAELKCGSSVVRHQCLCGA
jgi:hypothetical protein